jgi:hypothetical protein
MEIRQIAQDLSCETRIRTTKGLSMRHDKHARVLRMLA